MSFQESPRPSDEEEAFYMQCRAAYLAVFRSSLTNIASKQQLCRVLQQAGRNPSHATLNKYWTPRTSKLNFDDFCEILKCEKKTEETELMRAFKKMDVNSDGYITHSELEKALTTRGDKMTTEEVNTIFSLADINKDGKLDYSEFCRLLVSTAEQCQIAALERLEADAKLKRQNFGSQSYSPPKSSVSSASSSSAVQVAATHPQPPETSDATLKKDSRSSSRPSSARSRRSSLSNSITMTSSGTKASKIPEPSGFQEWYHSKMKGCFFLEDDGSISSLQYQLHVPQTTNIYLTIQPFSLSLSHRPDKCSSWMTVDTALFIMSAGETKEDSTLVHFTESKDKETYVWKGELNAGTYYLLPFTSGCRLKKRSKKSLSIKPVDLVYRTDTGELDLTRDLREALSDIFEVIDMDGNGLLSLEEYNFFELRTSGEKCDKDAWAVCKGTENFDMRKNQLTRQGFMELNLMEATEKDGDPADLWVTLEAMGYNRMLELVEACPFQIDVHCEGTQLLIQPLSMDSGPKLLNQALQKSITARTGAKALRGQDNVFIYTYRGEHRISSLIANKTNQRVTVHVNNEQSRNCSSSRGMSVFAVEVPARTKMVCQHVLPINEKQDWTYNCVETILTCT
ncbi:EF-hand calcium-binding domain-containing protein 7 isoform X1 [Seriola lalandi dorsalis]|uniref:EF-hand calcium-binding domain-containing protein 7 isoform X1 n=1 Tax=Seriola lalandi dorsalis TaxID=1841481 RepID=UPI000C6FC58A|nr:EF-hand calcium-binding domain-containing protein 7 isoform X1 [Seriola lalandi dorsalis]